MKKIFTLLFLTFSSVLFGQEIDSTNSEQIEAYQEFVYDMNSNTFKKQKYYSKLDHYYKSLWLRKTYTTNQVNNSLDTLVKNATLEIKEGDFTKYELKFSSYFPPYIDIGDINSKAFKLTITSHEVKDLNDNIVKIGSRGYTSFGTMFKSGYENGKSYSNSRKTAYASFRIQSEVEIQKGGLKGEILFNSRFLKGYDYIKIEKSDIGKSLLIGEIEFSVIDIVENTIILDFKQSLEDVTLFDFVNMDENRKRIAPIEYFDFQELQDEGKIPADNFYQGENLQTMNKSLINLFKLNPNLSFADFKKLTHKKIVEIVNSENQKETAKKVFGKEYVLFHFADKIQSFYLYMPKYIEKEFQMEIK